MQPQQAERLKRMISTSTILSQQEKQEWMDLLIVMNDKQVSELETILTAPEEQKSNLSHISNLPSSVAQTVLKSSPVPVAKYPLSKPRIVKPTAFKDWEAKLRRTLQEKELSSGPDEKTLPAHVLGNAIPTKREITQPRSQEATPLHKSALVHTEPTVKIVEPKDVQNLNVATMKAMGSQLNEVLKKAVLASNYFEVLFYLEKSPLYQAYLATGREALKDPANTFPATLDGKQLLTKAEFEAFSDLLKSMQTG